jgi:hypothetical protein
MNHSAVTVTEAETIKTVPEKMLKRGNSLDSNRHGIPKVCGNHNSP